MKNFTATPLKLAKNDGKPIDFIWSNAAFSIQKLQQKHQKTTPNLIRLQLSIVSGSIAFDCFAPVFGAYQQHRCIDRQPRHQRPNIKSGEKIEKEIKRI